MTSPISTSTTRSHTERRPVERTTNGLQGKAIEHVDGCLVDRNERFLPLLLNVARIFCDNRVDLLQLLCPSPHFIALAVTLCTWDVDTVAFEFEEWRLCFVRKDENTLTNFVGEDEEVGGFGFWPSMAWTGWEP